MLGRLYAIRDWCSYCGGGRTFTVGRHPNDPRLVVQVCNTCQNSEVFD